MPNRKIINYKPNNSVQARIAQAKYMSDMARAAAQRILANKKPGTWKSNFQRKLGGVITTRPNGRSYAGGNDLTSTKRSIYPKRPRSTKSKVNKNSQLIRNLMASTVYRFQNITNYDTNAGGIVLSNRKNTGTGAVFSPIHVYDITSFNNESQHSVGARLGWTTELANADVQRLDIPGQNETGSLGGGTWVQEDHKPFPDGAFPAANNALHNWSDIRFNFYGPRKRTTYFEVMFVVIKNQGADLLTASGQNVGAKLLLQYLERPLIYSNLQTDVGGKAHKFFKIVKRYRYYVSASQTTDVDTAVGKIKEAKIFMKHDRIRDYDWDHSFGGGDAGSILPHGPTDGLDYVRSSNVHNYTGPDKRMYMIVRAFSPERVNVTSSEDPAEASTEPSYDIMIRNKFSYTRGINS